MLDAAWRARYAEDDLDRAESARLLALALADPVGRLDLGFLPLLEELSPLRRVAARWAGPEGPGREAAGRVLRAAALALTGDEGGARAEISQVLVELAPDTGESDVLDAALLLRGLLRGPGRGRRAGGPRLPPRGRAAARRSPPPAAPPRARPPLRARAAPDRRGKPDDRAGLSEAAGSLAKAADAARAFADAHPEIPRPASSPWRPTSRPRPGWRRSSG